ncbi:alpha/beta fold hydrolase [Cryobacterium serini]|uniref:alpha/beta fold hydrolase n=1 Tax=Cryobacterium serini TaxID=1259201 RepID=UPI001F5420AD|nr:alpha/beta hydrolase [Cryobacterium serini]
MPQRSPGCHLGLERLPDISDTVEVRTLIDALPRLCVTRAVALNRMKDARARLETARYDGQNASEWLSFHHPKPLTPSADRHIPLAAAEETVAAIPAATFTILEGAGHFLFHERPAAARDAVDTWLESAK